MNEKKAVPANRQALGATWNHGKRPGVAQCDQGRRESDERRGRVEGEVSEVGLLRGLRV